MTDILAQIQMEYNATVHSVTGFSPHYLVFGSPMKLSVDIIVGAQKPTQKDKEDWIQREKVLLDNVRMAVDRIREAYLQAAGEEVLVWKEPKTLIDQNSHKKLVCGYQGPFRVISRIPGKDTYKVQRIKPDGSLDREELIVSILKLKRYYRAPKWLQKNQKKQFLYRNPLHKRRKQIPPSLRWSWEDLLEKPIKIKSERSLRERTSGMILRRLENGREGNEWMFGS